MRTDILLDLAAKLRSGEIRDENFVMESYVRNYKMGNYEELVKADGTVQWCGTAACIGGHVVLRHGDADTIRKCATLHHGWGSAAARILEVDEYGHAESDLSFALSCLFGAQWKTLPDAEGAWEATPAQAATEIEDFVRRYDAGEFKS